MMMMMNVDDVDKVVESGGKYESSGASRSEEGGEIKQCCNVIFVTEWTDRVDNRDDNEDDFILLAIFFIGQ